MKRIEAEHEVLVFFDDILMNEFVTSFSTGCSADGSIGRATINLLYLPSLDRVKMSSGSSSYLEDAVDDMTNCKLFIKNIFNGKYYMVFDGNIRGKNVVDSPGQESLSYTAIDNTNDLNKAVAPMAVPQDSTTIKKSVEFKINSQGMDISGMSSLTTIGDLKWSGMTISEVLKSVKDDSLNRNVIFSDAEGVLNWNAAKDRIVLMGDIQDKFLQTSVLDMQATIDAYSVDSLYVVMNDFVQRTMFEFFQDVDGFIKIKPPYWNEGILKSHIIDTSLIIGVSRNHAWENRYTRVLAKGDTAEIMKTSSDEIVTEYFTPMGTYVGRSDGSGFWTELRYNGSTLSSGSVPADDESSDTGTVTTSSGSGAVSSTIKFKVTPCTPVRVTSVYGMRNGTYHNGIDIGASSPGIAGQSLYAVSDGKVAFSGVRGTYGNTVIIDHGSWSTLYAHLQRVNCSYGQNVSSGAVIGFMGNSGASEGVHLHFEVRNKSIINDSKGFWARSTDPDEGKPYYACVNPASYLDIAAGDYDTVTSAYTSSNISCDLLTSSLAEKRYGLNTYITDQPLIKMSDTMDETSTNACFSALNQYAKFMFNLLNSSVSTAQVTMVGAPWLHPGMNCWLSPEKKDIVYYINSVSHSYDTESGVTTSLIVSHGRDGRNFFLGTSSVFGTSNAGAKPRDNVFINNIDIGPGAIGSTISSSADYSNYVTRVTNFHNFDDGSIIKAGLSTYHADLYASDKKASFATASANNMSKYLGQFSYGRWKADLISEIAAMYTVAPDVVKTRKKKLSAAITNARSEKAQYYITK